ncbi:hypothetical protein B0T16DRAFT_401333 [Cercophora newfieldiana]|uniref:Casein kinase II beta 2 subunit n=1 Tax=Cercophora newfieldiana TaxID=92897 RepID=A0AA40CZE6_9PEZI|nr:hypothetical protein B0T16DRAFT_401333 [Cercophora newfieldiana]
MPPGGGFLATQALRILTKNLARASKLLRARLANATKPVNAELQPAYARNTASCQPIHPVARLRQLKRVGKTYAHFNATVRRYLSTGGHSTAAPRFDRSKLPVSNTSRAVSRFTGRAPFASTLRPNLTGGTLGRSAGGYSMPGGGARYFSHTPAAPAQVVSNVSQAMRAFWLGGNRARYDGVDSNGKARYVSVNAAQEEARVRMSSIPRNAPGSYIDFRVSPTITALSPLGVVFPFTTTEQGFKPMTGETATLHAEGFLDVLSVDFARALQDLAAVMTDLKSLSVLGDLPVTLEKRSVIRIRFPGVDAETVERLCDDVGVRRGVVRQDADFDASVGVPVALRFPFAPDEGCDKTITSPGGSLRSIGSGGTEIEEMFLDEFEENPWLSPPETEGYESMSPPLLSNSGDHSSEDFEGLEGIYRFIEECDRARARV